MEIFKCGTQKNFKFQINFAECCGNIPKLAGDDIPTLQFYLQKICENSLGNFVIQPNNKNYEVFIRHSEDLFSAGKATDLSKGNLHSSVDNTMILNKLNPIARWGNSFVDFLSSIQNIDSVEGRATVWQLGSFHN